MRMLRETTFFATVNYTLMATMTPRPTATPAFRDSASLPASFAWRSSAEVRHSLVAAASSPLPVSVGPLGSFQLWPSPSFGISAEVPESSALDVSSSLPLSAAPLASFPLQSSFTCNASRDFAISTELSDSLVFDFFAGSSRFDHSPELRPTSAFGRSGFGESSIHPGLDPGARGGTSTVPIAIGSAFACVIVVVTVVAALWRRRGQGPIDHSGRGSGVLIADAGVRASATEETTTACVESLNTNVEELSDGLEEYLEA